MRWSSMVRVGLSGTSLALAMMGCSKGDDAKREPAETSEVSDYAGKSSETDADAKEAERAEKRDKERELEAARVRDEEARRLAERNASSEPSPWFLRGPGDTKQASVQGGSQEQPRPIADKPEQPKPVQVQPKPIQPVQQRPGGWQHRAACGRG